jgi:hypothetical protein
VRAPCCGVVAADALMTVAEAGPVLTTVAPADIRGLAESARRARAIRYHQTKVRRGAASV